MTAKKIVLVQPPFYRLFDEARSYNAVHLSLAYLAGAISANTSWDVEIYNADFNGKTFLEGTTPFFFRTSQGYDDFVATLQEPERAIWHEVRGTLEELRPSAVGITATTQNFRSACAVAHLVKSIDRATTVIVGGAHPSMVGAEVLDSPDIDIAVIGEGELTIVELLDALENRSDLSSVQGIAYRAGDERRTTPPRELIADLDLLPFPHLAAQRALRDYPLYPKSAFYSILSSRGCPYRCSFCGSAKIWGGTVRLRSPENVIQELEGVQQLGIDSIHFADDTFGWNREWTEALCHGMITRCPGLKWKCEVHVSQISDDLLRLMKRGGCRTIELGIESGDNRILQAVHKKITIEQALEACRLVKRHGMELQVYLMVGFPQETEESLARTREVIQKISGHICLSVFFPAPGTEIYDSCREQGILPSDFDPTAQNFQEPAVFCPAIPQERFRETVRAMMQEVDKHNSLDRMLRAFSVGTLWRIKEMGIRSAFMKGVEILHSTNLLSRTSRPSGQ